MSLKALLDDICCINVTLNEKRHLCDQSFVDHQTTAKTADIIYWFQEAEGVKHLLIALHKICGLTLR